MDMTSAMIAWADEVNTAMEKLRRELRTAREPSEPIAIAAAPDSSAGATDGDAGEASGHE